MHDKFFMTNDQVQIGILIATGLASLAASFAAYQAKRIGDKQNEINQRALDIQNFVELFVMPQQVIGQNEDGKSALIRWNILIKNVSSYPVYLHAFSLSGLRHPIGSSAIPNNSENWYGVPIQEDIQKKGEFSLEIEFEDYLGDKYSSKHTGLFDGITWQIKSEKRVLL